MAKYLVIVESPAKVNTIKKFLGANYQVMASNGHVRDLPKSQLGFDVKNDYEPSILQSAEKGIFWRSFVRKQKRLKRFIQATDPDREGEAISWHLSKALKLEDDQIKRITFNEITKMQ